MRFADLPPRPRPISTAPTDDEFAERVLLLYCPEQGGWHTGVWFEGSWRAHIEIDRVLEATFWLPAPLDPSG
jgi:hypothetical protein